MWTTPMRTSMWAKSNRAVPRSRPRPHAGISDHAAVTPVAVAARRLGFFRALLLAAAAAGAAWLATLGTVMVVRRPPRIGVTPGGGSLETPPEPPPSRACVRRLRGRRGDRARDPARSRGTPRRDARGGPTGPHRLPAPRADDGPLTHYEEMVLDQLRGKALGGVVPADALTTGTDDSPRCGTARSPAMSSPMRNSGGSRATVAGACRRTARRGRARRRRTVVRGGRGRR